MGSCCSMSIGSVRQAEKSSRDLLCNNVHIINNTAVYI